MILDQFENKNTDVSQQKKNDYLQILKSLLEAGLDTQLENNEGKTPLALNSSEEIHLLVLTENQKRRETDIQRALENDDPVARFNVLLEITINYCTLFANPADKNDKFSKHLRELSSMEKNPSTEQITEYLGKIRSIRKDIVAANSKKNLIPSLNKPSMPERFHFIWSTSS